MEVFVERPLEIPCKAEVRRSQSKLRQKHFTVLLGGSTHKLESVRARLQVLLEDAAAVNSS